MIHQLAAGRSAAVRAMSEEDKTLEEKYGLLQSVPTAIRHQTTLKRLLSFHCMMPAAALMLFLLGILSTLLYGPFKKLNDSCTTQEHEDWCQHEMARNWGQYSPYFTVPSHIPDVMPSTCQTTFAQVLSRHGARYPTTSKTLQYGRTIHSLHQNATSYSGKYAFLATYTYALGANDLTIFGQHQMISSGVKFYGRYNTLTRVQTPFFRATTEARVLASAQNFTQGYHDAQLRDPLAFASKSFPYEIVTIPEALGENNTLSHGLCDAFEESTTGSTAQSTYAASFIPPIQARLNHDLPGAVLDGSQTLDLMDLCPFETVASIDARLSPFCSLFTESEWQQYSYYQSLGKWYGYGNGNILGPTQGVGFTNELIARMTGKPVRDTTSSNHTLDDNPATFPIGPAHVLFADFSHDNDMTGHFAAMGLYNNTSPLSNTSRETEQQTDGFSAAWTVPFAARAYVEKMVCDDADEEYVRILVNDRVIRLPNCGADDLGRCKLSAWITSLSFAQSNGYWDRCLKK